MLGKIKGIFLIGIVLFLNSAAFGQKHFVYLQSDNGTPFYVKLSDSVISSSAAGYLILTNLNKGDYKLVVGLPKKTLPESAFRISVDGSSDKGYVLESEENKLQLKDIADNSIIKPDLIASSAGNRITSSALDNLPDAAQESQKSSATIGKSDPVVASGAGEKQVEDSVKGLSFEEMLNAVTGHSPDAERDELARTAAEQKAKKEDIDQKEEGLAESMAQTPVPDTAVDIAEADVEPTLVEGRKKTETGEPDKKNQGETDQPPLLAFDKLMEERSSESKKKEEPLQETIKEDALEKPQNEQADTAPLPKSNAGASAEDLTFIQFQDNERSEGQENKVDEEVRTEKPDNQVGKPKSNKVKKLNFDNFLAKLDSVGKKKTSVANPLIKESSDGLSDSLDQVQDESENCLVVADLDYFGKVYKKIASKSNQEAMLRTAKRSFDEDRCYSFSQLEKIAYLFSSDDYRYEFLQFAYPHCSEKEKSRDLLKLISDPALQRELRKELSLK